MSNSYKKEQIPYEDLTKLELEHDIVVARNTPKKTPEFLNHTNWKIECKHCGATRTASGRLLLTGENKKCNCRTEKKLSTLSDDGDKEVGLGAIHLMNNDPSKFAEYIKRRDEESRRSNCSRFNYLNSKKVK